MINFLLNFFVKNNKELWFVWPTIFLFYISGYDFLCLSDENLLFTIVSTIVVLIYYSYTDALILLHKTNKLAFIKEYYYKFYLIKSFYLTYLNYLRYNFFLYNNYNSYYNIYYNYLKNILIIFNNRTVSSYFKFFFNYLNSYNNKVLFKFIELNFLTVLNIYYLVSIAKFLNEKK